MQFGVDKTTVMRARCLVAAAYMDVQTFGIIGCASSWGNLYKGSLLSTYTVSSMEWDETQVLLQMCLDDDIMAHQSISKVPMLVITASLMFGAVPQDDGRPCTRVKVPIIVRPPLTLLGTGACFHLRTRS